MHGVKREKASEEVAIAQKVITLERITNYNNAVAGVMEKRKANILDEETLKQINKILEINPDFYSLWNYRKTILLELFSKKSNEEIQVLCKDELGFIEITLRKNPKSYCSWYHRKWLTNYLPKQTDLQIHFKRELKLCSILLDADQRNFHCWAYRDFVVQKAGVSPSDEFNFTTEKINKDFSNYSAWHYRSTYIEKILSQQQFNIDSEFELVQNCFYTKPQDQSPWMYHQWLVGKNSNQLDVIGMWPNESDSSQSLVLFFSQHVSLQNAKVTLKSDNTEVQGNWIPLKPNSLNKAKMWIFSCIEEKDKNQLKAVVSIKVQIESMHDKKEPIFVLSSDTIKVFDDLNIKDPVKKNFA